MLSGSSDNWILLKVFASGERVWWGEWQVWVGRVSKGSGWGGCQLQRLQPRHIRAEPDMPIQGSKAIRKMGVGFVDPEARGAANANGSRPRT